MGFTKSYSEKLAVDKRKIKANRKLWLLPGNYFGLQSFELGDFELENSANLEISKSSRTGQNISGNTRFPAGERALTVRFRSALFKCSNSNGMWASDCEVSSVFSSEKCFFARLFAWSNGKTTKFLCALQTSHGCESFVG